MLKEFKEFAMRGSLLDLAVGIILGVAFGAIITSLVNDVIMPPIGMLLGGVDFNNLLIDLSGRRPTSLAQAKQMGAPVVAYGTFFNTIITFLIVAFVLFLVIRAVNRWQRPTVEGAPATKSCPFCFSTIPVMATRCPNCTSALTLA